MLNFASVLKIFHMFCLGDSSGIPRYHHCDGIWKRRFLTRMPEVLQGPGSLRGLKQSALFMISA